MAIVRITNGFENHGGQGILLTGTLIEGDIAEGDKLILNKGTTIPIIDVEFDKETFPGTTHVRLMFSRDHEIVWHKLYYKEFAIENTNHNNCF